MKELLPVNKYFWKYKWLLLLGILFVILTNYFRILAPQITGFVANTVLGSLEIQHPKSANQYLNSINSDSTTAYLLSAFNTKSIKTKVLYAGIILFLLAIISGLFMFMMRQTIIVMSRHIEFDQKNEIYNHYQKLDISFYKKNAIGDLMNRISEDVSRVRMYTGPALMYFINLAAVIGFSIYFMFRSDVKLALVALSPLPILAITIYYVNSIINKKSEYVQQELSNLTSNAQESYSGIRVIKSYLQEKMMISFFGKSSKKYQDNALSLAKTEAIYFPSMSLLIGLSTLITIMVGTLDVVNGKPGANIGKITEFVLYIQMLTFPVSAIGWTASIIQRASASQKRINEFLDTKPLIINSIDGKSFKFGKYIKFTEVNFTYSNTGIKAIDQVNFSIQKGEKIAIIGKTGSGKTTLALLLLRMYDLNGGNILFDDHNIHEFDIANLRTSISYVPQDVFLFSDTIINNILFGDENADINRVYEAAKKAGIYDEIIQFPNGFETLIGERGITLSGGQKQRISVARAIIKNPDLIIFDDCFSAVDSKTEDLITTQLNTYLQHKTAIIITHRLYASLKFDKIIIMDKGKIIEMGSHEELLKNNKYYIEFYTKQLSTNIL